MGTSIGRADCLELRVTVGKNGKSREASTPSDQAGEGRVDREAASPLPSPRGECLR
jgi:hypothetical protein